jgi:hypothetical protein
VANDCRGQIVVATDWVTWTSGLPGHSAFSLDGKRFLGLFPPPRSTKKRCLIHIKAYWTGLEFPFLAGFPP